MIVIIQNIILIPLLLIVSYGIVYTVKDVIKSVMEEGKLYED